MIIISLLHEPIVNWTKQVALRGSCSFISPVHLIQIQPAILLKSSKSHGLLGLTSRQLFMSLEGYSSKQVVTSKGAMYTVFTLLHILCKSVMKRAILSAADPVTEEPKQTKKQRNFLDLYCGVSGAHCANINAAEVANCNKQHSSSSKQHSGRATKRLQSATAWGRLQQTQKSAPVRRYIHPQSAFKVTSLLKGVLIKHLDTIQQINTPNTNEKPKSLKSGTQGKIERKLNCISDTIWWVESKNNGKK